MSAQFSISAPEEKDIKVLGDLLLRSKLSLSINRLLWNNWPNETAQREQYTAAVEGAFKDPNMLDLKAVDMETGQIAGYVCFTKKEMNAQNDTAQPQAEDDGTAPAQSQDTPATMDANVLAGVMKACQEIASGLDFPKNYGKLKRSPTESRKDQALTVGTELIFIVVDQAFRGKGLGSQLMQRGFAEARAAGLPLCVCSEPAPRSFFDRSGFSEVVHADMDLSAWAPPYTGFGVFRLAGMVWRPE